MVIECFSFFKESICLNALKVLEPHLSLRGELMDAQNHLTDAPHELMDGFLLGDQGGYISPKLCDII